MENLEDSDMDDVLVTAFEGGINYWCNKVKVINDDYKGGEYASNVVSRGGELELDVDESTPVRLNKTKLHTALHLYKDKFGKPFDIETHDAGDADVLVQLAVFGEVVYG